METLIPAEARALCRVEEIDDGGTKGFPAAPGGFNGLVAYRKGDAIHVYVNSCPFYVERRQIHHLRDPRGRLRPQHGGVSSGSLQGRLSGCREDGSPGRCYLCPQRRGFMTIVQREGNHPVPDTHPSGDQLFPVRADFAAKAFVDQAGYRSRYEHAARDPNGYWAKEANRIAWMKPPTKIKNTSFNNDVSIKWFEDGTLNASVSCLDRHLAINGDRTAIIWESDDPNVSH